MSLVFTTKINIVVKAEYHFNEGFLTDDLASNLFFAAPDETEYGILSVAYSF